MSTAKKTLYAAIGAGTTVVGKARELPQRISTFAKSDRTIALDPRELRQLPKQVQAFGASIPERATKLVDESRKLADMATERTQELFIELTKRGESLYKKVQRSAPTERAKAQTTTAKSKVKGATTAVKKAAAADAKAVKAAVEKVADATEASA